MRKRMREAILEGARDLHAAGAIDDARLTEFERMMVPEPAASTPRQFTVIVQMALLAMDEADARYAVKRVMDGSEAVREGRLDFTIRIIEQQEGYGAR